MLSVIYGECRRQGYYAVCRYAECRHPECRGADCHVCEFMIINYYIN
jgi:hypothetical protein